MEQIQTEDQPQIPEGQREVDFEEWGIGVDSREINADSLYLMGPDIRAARGQLEPVVLKLYKDDAAGHLAQGRKYLKSQTEELPSYSHPTPMTLIQNIDRGGFHNVDAIVWLSQLYMLLTGLAFDYALGLEVIAELLDRTKQSEVGGAGLKVKSELSSPLIEEVLRLVEKGG